MPTMRHISTTDHPVTALTRLLTVPLHVPLYAFRTTYQDKTALQMGGAHTKSTEETGVTLSAAAIRAGIA